MKDICVYIPTVKVLTTKDGREVLEERDSQLWKDIMNHFNKDREKSKDLYCLLKCGFEKHLKNVQYDEAGEVVFSSVKDQLNLDNMMNDEQKMMQLAKEYGLLDKDGNKFPFINVMEAISKANEFNAKDKRFRAVPQMEGNTITCDIKPCYYGQDYVKGSLAFSSNLNNNIIYFLNQLGFEISFEDLSNNKFKGLFMPENAKTLTNGLINIIKVSNDQEGFDAIPEEFAHLLIQGLSHTPLVQKMISSLLTPINGQYMAIQHILGDMYETYEAYYMLDGEVDMEMMAKEAAGKLLAQAINGQDMTETSYIDYEGSTRPARNFVERILRFIKSIFKGTPIKIMQDIVVDAQEKANFISNQFINNRESLLKEIAQSGLNNILNSRNMYEVTEQISEFSKLQKETFDLIKYTINHDINRVMYHNDYVLLESMNIDIDSKNFNNAQNSIKDLVERFQDDRSAHNEKQLREALYSIFQQRIRTLDDIKNSGPDVSGNNIDPLIFFLQSTATAVQDSLEALRLESEYIQQKFNDGELTTIDQIREFAKTLNYIKRVYNTFNEFSSKLEKVYDFEEYKNPLVSIVADDDLRLKKIKEKRDEIVKEKDVILGNIGRQNSQLISKYNILSRKLLIYMVQQYLPNGYTVKLKDGSEETIMAEDIVDMAKGDLSRFDTFTKGMYQCSDVFLNILNNIFADLKGYNRQVLLDLEQGIRGLQEKLEESDSDTTFMFEYDENGIKTGRYISDCNFQKWAEDRQKAIETFKQQNSDPKIWRVNLYDWDKEHTTLCYKEDPNSIMPNIHYKENGVEIYNTHKLNTLTPAQKQYYDEFMLTKSVIDRKYPKSSTNLYTCILISKNDFEKKMDLVKNPSVSQITSDIVDSWTEGFTIKPDDADYAVGQKIRLGIDGNPIESVPVKYTCNAFDMLDMPENQRRQLTDDCSSALLAYAAAGTNYECCRNLLNQYIIAEDFIRNVRKVPSTQSYVYNRETGNQEQYNKDQELRNKFADRLKEWRISNMLGNRKNIQEFQIGNYIINYGAIGDMLRMFTTKFRLSFNTVHLFMNYVDEQTQAIIESTNGEFFDAKSYLKGEVYCMNKMLDHITQVNSINPNDDLELIAKALDMDDDYEDNLREANLRNSTIQRNLGMNWSLMFTKLGELHNHRVPGFAHLHFLKAKNKNGEEVDLIEAFEKLEYKVGDSKAYKIIIKDGYKITLKSNRFDGGEKTFDFDRSNINPKEFENYNADTRDVNMREYLKNLSEFMLHLSNNIKEVNRRMNGAMSSIDNGVGQRYIIGRLLMHFRRWQVAYMTNRYGNDFLNANGEIQQAYWRYTGYFLMNNIRNWYLESYKASQDSDYNMYIDLSLIEDKDKFRTVKDQLKKQNIKLNNKSNKINFKNLSKEQRDRVKQILYDNDIQFDFVFKSSIFDKRYQWSKMSAKEKGYVKRAATELVLLTIGLMASAWLGGDFGWDDDDKKKHPYDDTQWEGIGRFMYMLTLRGSLELEASVPSLSTLDSFIKLFEDPFPVIDNVAQMIKFINPSYMYRNIGRESKKSVLGITDRYTQQLITYLWPQIRQYENFMELVFDKDERQFRWYLPND